MDCVLGIFGTQVTRKKRPVWPVFSDHLSVSYDYGTTDKPEKDTLDGAVQSVRIQWWQSLLRFFIFTANICSFQRRLQCNNFSSFKTSSRRNYKMYSKHILKTSLQDVLKIASKMFAMCIQHVFKKRLLNVFNNLKTSWRPLGGQNIQPWRCL